MIGEISTYLLILSVVLCIVIFQFVENWRLRLKIKALSLEMNSRIISAQIEAERKKAMVSFLSHEIRTPLNIIAGLTKTAERCIDDRNKLQECFSKLENEGKYLMSVFSNMLDIAKFHGEKLDLQNELVSLYAISDELWQMFTNTACNKNVQLVFDCRLKYYIVTADKVRVSEILANLISNACNFVSENARVTVKIEELAQEENPGRYRFSVSNLPNPQKHGQIEYLLEHIDKDDDNELILSGMGLGLRVTQQILLMMGSRLCVSQNQNSEFVIFFDLELPVASLKEAVNFKNEMDRQWNLRGKRVMIVDDNEMNTDVMADLLADEGVESTKVFGGSQAIDAYMNAKENSFDAILMDINMPDMSGTDAARKIRAAKRGDAAEIPIIALTSFSFKNDVEESLSAGMNAHLTKPVDIESVCRLLDKCINTPKKAEREN